MTRPRVLMIAYHFPPIQGSSGVQRTLRFVKYLPDFGWDPVVLSISPKAYASTTEDQMPDIAPGVVVERAWGLDAARQLSIMGRYPGFLARPDRWMSWRLGARASGMRLIRELRPAAIWSTYPIATAHQIGCDLAKASGLPWIADFRDPMAQDGYPADPATWQSFARIEKSIARHAAHCTFTTPSALRTYQQRFADRADDMSLIENGYDEETFAGLSRRGPLAADRITLLHSGIVYPSERDPTALIDALALLARDAPATANRLRVRFRAPVHGDLLNRLADERGVTDMTEVLPPVGYAEALDEMVNADALLILQAANCNQQIPAKLYEYLRAGSPVIALTDPSGDTAWALGNAGVSTIAPLDDASAIASLLATLPEGIAQGALPLPGPDAVKAASRLGRSEQLAALLDRLPTR